MTDDVVLVGVRLKSSLTCRTSGAGMAMTIGAREGVTAGILVVDPEGAKSDVKAFEFKGRRRVTTLLVVGSVVVVVVVGLGVVVVVVEVVIIGISSGRGTSASGSTNV